MHIISWYRGTVIYSDIPWQMGHIWFVDHLFLRKRVAENSLILLTNYVVLISHPPPPAPEVSTWACRYLEFWLLPSNWNPHGSQYFILMGSNAFKNRIQTSWAVSKGDDFLLNAINPANPVWNLINTSDKGRKCCFLSETEQIFHNEMCLLLIRSPEMREGQFPGALNGLRGRWRRWSLQGGRAAEPDPPSWSHSAWGESFPASPVFKLHQESNNRGFPGGPVVKNPPANAGGTGSSPGLGRSHMPRSN